MYSSTYNCGSISLYNLSQQKFTSLKYFATLCKSSLLLIQQMRECGCGSRCCGSSGWADVAVDGDPADEQMRMRMPLLMGMPLLMRISGCWCYRDVTEHFCYFVILFILLFCSTAAVDADAAVNADPADEICRWACQCGSSRVRITPWIEHEITISWCHGSSPGTGSKSFSS